MSGKIPAILLLLALVLILLLTACGGDGDSRPTGPSGVAIDLDLAYVLSGGTVSVSAAYTSDRELPDCVWYVDGIEGGSAELGTIAQNNPTMYIAPAQVPPGARVEIAVVTSDGEAFEDGVTITVVEDADIYVDAIAGTDEGGAGGMQSPFRTISYALGVAEAGNVVLILPGTYDTDLGEATVYTIPEGVVLRGLDQDSCIVVCAVDEFTGMEVSTGATVENITLSNQEPVGDEVRTGVGISSRGDVTIRGIIASKRFVHSVIRAHGADEVDGVLIEDCVLINTNEPGNSRGMELVFSSHAIARNCVVSGWRTGIFTNLDSDPLIEYCTITDNGVGVEVYADQIDEPPFNNIDLGGGARGSEGNNVIQGNSDYGLWNRNLDGPVFAKFNSWNSDPPSESAAIPSDYYAPYGADWIWE